MNDPTTFNNSTAVSVYDSLGNAHTLQTYLRQNGTPATWDVYASSWMAAQLVAACACHLDL